MLAFSVCDFQCGKPRINPSLQGWPCWPPRPYPASLLQRPSNCVHSGQKQAWCCDQDDQLSPRTHARPVSRDAFMDLSVERWISWPHHWPVEFSPHAESHSQLRLCAYCFCTTVKLKNLTSSTHHKSGTDSLQSWSQRHRDPLQPQNQSMKENLNSWPVPLF